MKIKIKYDFLSDEYLMKSYKKAKKSRKDKLETYLFDYHQGENLLKLRDELRNHKYHHQPYKKIILFDSKKRYIFSPTFRDHIVHHMLYGVLYDVFDKKFIDQTYACRVGYGAHRCIKDMQKVLRKMPPNTYYLKMDISKYFYSISHEKLKNLIFQTVKNADLKYVITQVIDSYQTGHQFDELFLFHSKYRQTRQKGIPIGSIISQLFANLYLHQLDHQVKHILKISHYFRYMDDFVLIGEKRELQNAKQKIYEFLVNELDLVVHPKKISFHLIDDGINFVGYRLKNAKIYVGKRTKLKTNKFLDALQKVDISYLIHQDRERVRSSFESRIGVFTHSSFGKNYIKKRGNIDFSAWWECE